MNILIVGAGNVGRYLAHILVEADHTVTLVECDERQIERAHQESGARVIHGDATEPSVLERAGVRGMDVVVAATGDDEDNLVVSNMAKVEFEVPRVVGRVKNATNTWLYEPDIGVDLVVSAPHTIAQLIEEEVVVGSVVQLLQLPHGQAAIVEVTVAPESPVTGQAIDSVQWPAGCAPLATVRDSLVIAVTPEVRIEPGDRLIFVATEQQGAALHALISNSSLPAASS